MVKNFKDSSLTEINFGNVYGKCVAFIADVGENTRIYEVKPNIRGNFGMPIRVMTTMFLSIGSFYSIKGYLDTTYLNKLIVPVLSVTKITKVDKKNVEYNYSLDIIENIKFASFIVVNNLTVMDIVPNKNSFILTLSKETKTSKSFVKLDFAALTTIYCTEDAKGIKKGDIISILGTIHRDRKYDGRNFYREIGVKILKFNIESYEVDELKTSLTELHNRSKNIE